MFFIILNWVIIKKVLIKIFLKKNISLVVSLVYIFCLNAPLISAEQSKNKKIDSLISVEYLSKKLFNHYIIGPGDMLNIKVSRDYPELNTEAIVDSEGTLYLPKLNRVYVSGLTINELNNVLNEAFMKFVKYPSVEVVIKKYRPITIFVEGEVENPGLYVLEGSFAIKNDTRENPNHFFPTLYDAIKKSGGITEFSELSNMEIIRKNKLSDGGGKIKTNVNFENVLLGQQDNNLRIYDGDTIRVKKAVKKNNFNYSRAITSNLNPKFIDVVIAGRVNAPGSISLSRASVLSDAMLVAGGKKTVSGPITFIRYENNGNVDKRTFRFKKNRKRGSYKNPSLKNGDIIFVGNNALTIASDVISEVSNPLSGAISTYSLIKVLQD